MDKPVVALFDFDGTLTRRDTLPLFIRHATGWGGLLLSMITLLPSMIILACSGWKSVWGIDAQSTKEKLLSRCFRGKCPHEVNRCAEDFIPTIDAVIAPNLMKRMQQHIAQGHHVAIVTASVDVWVAPWAKAHSVNNVFATRLQLNNGTYTGAFDGKNCNGVEKVERIASTFPRSQYHIIAYGNSHGDVPMLQYAHEAYMCSDGEINKFT